MKKSHKRSVSYQESLIEDLKDHDEAVAYLSAALEESELGDEESQQLLLKALKNVAEAQGGIGTIAKKAHVRREVLYRTLSSQGNPTLGTFFPLIRALGLRLEFC